MDEFEKAIINILKQHTGLDDIRLEVPPSLELGDFAFACFPLAKAHKKSPVQVASELAENIKPDSHIAGVKSEGPYLNFFINKPALFEKTIQKISANADEYGSSSRQPQKIMVEFSSPNTNKPLHLGHLRNIAIGESVSRIFEKNNNHVVRSCIVNDRGIHIIKSILAYMEKGNGRDPDKKPDHFVGDFYVEYSNMAEADPQYEDLAKKLLKDWESGEPKIRELWNKMNEWVYDGFNQTYKKLGITFDKVYYESQIYEKGKEIVLQGLKEGKFQNKDGAVIAKLEEFGLPDKVLIRSDGTSIYMTQDIYLAKIKFEEYHLDKSIYVVATEQNLHFNQLFKILEILGYSWADECYHLAYGMVYLPEGKMKSREGLVVDADDIIQQTENLAKKEVSARYNLSDNELKDRAKKIAMAALKFHLLKHDAYRDMTYDPKESISFQGETGPYVQYTYARIQSILKKAESPFKDADYGLLEHPSEWGLVRSAAFFPNIVMEAQTNLKPSVIARYLLDTAQMFNEYYHDVPILRSEEKLRQARIMLIKSIGQVLKNGLNLLGIDAIEEM